MNERHLQFRVGLFVLLATGIATALIMLFGDVQKYWQKTYAIAVHFDEAQGTHPGCPVRMNGVLIGEVREILLDEKEPGVLVVLDIREDRRIRIDARPSLSRALFGDASIDFSGEEKVLIKANSEERALAVLDVFQTWLIKRKVSLKHLDYGNDDKTPTPRISGKEYRLEIGLKEGISQEVAKKIGKIIRDEGPKSVKSQIQGDELRVTSKSRDDLQAVQQLLNGKDLDTALQYTNRR